MMSKQNNHPKLTYHLGAGNIWKDGNTYIGRAGDGTEVEIGQVGDEANIEWWLTSGFGDPQSW